MVRALPGVGDVDVTMTANTRGGGLRRISSPRRDMSDIAPDAMIADSNQPSSRYSRLLPVLIAARPIAIVMKMK